MTTIHVRTFFSPRSCFSLCPFSDRMFSLLVKSDKQLLSTELGSKVAWNSSAFLGPNLWEKDQLYSATGPSGLQHDKLLSGGSSSSTTTTTSASILSTTNSSSSSSSSSSTTATTTTTTNNNGSNANFKVENIDIDEFLCENNLNLNDIDSFSNQFEHVEQTRSNSPNGNCDPLLLHSPMQAAPAKSPMDDSISSFLPFPSLSLHPHLSLVPLGHQSSSSSRKYSQDEGSTKTGHSRQSKKARKAAAAAANLAKVSLSLSLFVCLPLIANVSFFVLAIRS